VSSIDTVFISETALLTASYSSIEVDEGLHKKQDAVKKAKEKASVG
jgi:hypothetical protein